MIAIARHMGVEHDRRTGSAWPGDPAAGRPAAGRAVPGGEIPSRRRRAGVLKELLAAGKLHGDVRTVTGRTLAEDLAEVPDGDREVIRPYDAPLLPAAGYVVMSGNLFDSAVMKISVIDKEFRAVPVEPGPAERLRGQGDRVRWAGGLSPPHRGSRAGRGGAVGADHPQLRPRRLSRQRRGGEHAAACGAAEARHQHAADDGRRAAIGDVGVTVDPERVAGSGGRRRAGDFKTGDRIRIDLNRRKVDVLLPKGELEARKATWQAPKLNSMTPWEEIYRAMVGQLGTGACRSRQRCSWM